MDSIRERKEKGFTLIELLVVISVITMLSSVVLTSVSAARVRAYDAVRISDMQQISRAVEMFYEDNKFYPPTEAVSSVGNVNMTEVECATQPLPKPGWCQLRDFLKPYINLQFPPINSGNDIQISFEGISYWHEVRYFYRSPLSADYKIYGLATALHSPGNLPMMISDGGAYNEPISGILPMYEVGSLPTYCGAKYTGSNRNWTGFSVQTTCLGGN